MHGAKVIINDDVLCGEVNTADWRKDRNGW